MSDIGSRVVYYDHIEKKYVTGTVVGIDPDNGFWVVDLDNGKKIACPSYQLTWHTP